MSARVFEFEVGERNCWAQAHPSKYPTVTLTVRAGSSCFTASLKPAEARAMATALEAAATHSENTLATGLGESVVDA